MMDHDKKLAFVLKMTKHALDSIPHMDQGGVAQVKHYDSGGIATNSNAPGVGPSNDTNIAQGGIQNISNALGLNAQSANIQNGTNAAQLNNAYTGANNAINAQVGLANTLTPQASSAANNQNAVAQSELNTMNGVGPNPAQAELNQNTGTNIAQTAALMAGQRGAGANPGLIATQAAQQGAATQQQAVGQEATTEANQAIAAQQNLANLSNNQVTQSQNANTALNTAQQNEQGILQNANTASNNAAVSQQSNINNVNAQQNSNVLSGVTGALQQVPVVGSLFSGFAHGGEVHSHVCRCGKCMLAAGGQPTQPMVPGINPSPAVSVGQYMNSSAPSSNIDINSGSTLNLKTNKDSKKTSPSVADNPLSGAQDLQGSDSTEFGGSSIGDSGVSGLAGAAEEAGPDLMLAAYHGGKIHQHFESHFKNYFSGGQSSKVPAMVSPGEIYLSPEKVKAVIEGGANPLKIGQKFQGKAKVKGDSLKNDIIPATLDSGGVVIDRKHVMNPEKAALFVHRAMAKKRIS